MIRPLTQTNIDKIVIDEGYIVLDYGEATEIVLGPTRGGGEFAVEASVREIDFDGKKGPTKGLQAIEEIKATLKVTTLVCSQQTLELALPDASIGASPYNITSGDVGLIPLAKYRKNITMFAKTADGKFKKIQIFNPMHESGLTFAAKPKSENEHALEFVGHFDPTEQLTTIYSIIELSYFPADPAPSKTNLLADINSTVSLNEELYTSATWGPCYVALVAAQAVNADSGASQSQIDAAEDALEAAVAALVLR